MSRQWPHFANFGPTSDLTKVAGGNFRDARRSNLFHQLKQLQSASVCHTQLACLSSNWRPSLKANFGAELLADATHRLFTPKSPTRSHNNDYTGRLAGPKLGRHMPCANYEATTFGASNQGGGIEHPTTFFPAHQHGTHGYLRSVSDATQSDMKVKSDQGNLDIVQMRLQLFRCNIFSRIATARLFTTLPRHP